MAAKLGALPLHQVPPGSFVSSLQLYKNNHPVFARAPGSYVQVMRRRGSYTTVRLPSGELRRVHALRWSIFNQFPQFSYRRSKYYKAGQLRQLGVRPYVRGCAMNPVDHPHGGRTGESRPSVSPWGLLTKGPRTRRRPIDPKVIIRTVRQYRNRRRLFFSLMRDLKRRYPYLLHPFKPEGKIFSPSYRFIFKPPYERIYYHDGKKFRSLPYKKSLSGYPLGFFKRTKIIGRSIHQRSKKKKKK
jgi:hypothetical protein